jgi:hypothetical protein
VPFLQAEQNDIRWREMGGQTCLPLIEGIQHREMIAEGHGKLHVRRMSLLSTAGEHSATS